MSGLCCGDCLAYGKIPDGIFLQPGPRGFCLSLRSNKNIAPGFKSSRKQRSLLSSPNNKAHSNEWALLRGLDLNQ